MTSPGTCITKSASSACNSGALPRQGRPASSVAAAGLSALRVAPGKATGGVYQLAPGEYTLYCDITGHREAGMQASLTVTGGD